MYDGEPEGALCFSGGKLYPKKLLGQADLHLAHIEVLVDAIVTHMGTYFAYLCLWTQL